MCRFTTVIPASLLLSEINQNGTAIHLRVLRIVDVFIKMTFQSVGAAIAGTWSSASAGTLKRIVFRAVRSAVSSIWTFAAIVAFKGHLAFCVSDR